MSHKGDWDRTKDRERANSNFDKIKFTGCKECGKQWSHMVGCSMIEKEGREVGGGNHKNEPNV
jgi:hypothetical protein